MSIFSKRFRKTPDEEFPSIRVRELYLKDGEKRVKLEKEVFIGDACLGEVDSFFTDIGDLSLDELYNIYEEA